MRIKPPWDWPVQDAPMLNGVLQVLTIFALLLLGDVLDILDVWKLRP